MCIRDRYVDSVKAFSANFDHIDFNTTRYCNAQLDGELYKANKMEYHRCYKLPNNKLDIYGKEQLQGRITTQPGKEHHIRSVVIDANGNRSELTFMLKGATASESITWPTTTPIGSLLRYDSENVMAEAGVRLTLPALALYEDAYVHYERKDAPSNAITPLHVLHDACLLYTSDAADERSSVDLGGRRIIKKKNNVDEKSPEIKKYKKRRKKNNKQHSSMI